MTRRAYWLRNTTRRDISLGDLRYKIPAGHSRNLLSKTAYLSWELIQQSKESGSIAARLETGALMEVKKAVNLRPPPKTTAKEAAKFNNRVKTSVVLNTEELDDQLNNMVLEEEDELLKELQEADFMSEAPLVHKEKKDDGSKTQD